MITLRNIRTDDDDDAVMTFNVSVPASRASTLSTWVQTIQETIELVTHSDPTPLVDSAEELAKLIVKRARPNNALLNEHAARQRTISEIVSGSQWLTAEQINEMQTPRPENKNLPASEWKRQKRIFSVSLDRERYASYQFDMAGRPLPIVKELLKQLGDIADPWKIAAWFHFPNGWIEGRNGEAIAPKDALDLRAPVLHAAEMKRGSYVA